MLLFQCFEVLLEPSHVDEVCCELGVVATALLPNLLDDMLRISLDQELPDNQG
jgi:hypothetical protein